MMRFLTPRKAAIAALMAVLTLSACGSDNQKKDITDQLVGSLNAALAQRKAKGQPQAAALVTRAAGGCI